ncbi:hypothetical protein CLU79DRAFT_755809 [Phycomyces nitens]|nr:hypothetical protein CLU79DRAFT_755809 [Phycomyces nitens]
MHFDEYPKDSIETIDLFEFAQVLQRVKSCSSKNKSDVRTRYYRQRAALASRDHLSEKTQREQLEIQLECISHNLKVQTRQMAGWEDKQRRLENQLRAVYQKNKKAIFSTRSQVEASKRLCEARLNLTRCDHNLGRVLLENDLRLVSIQRGKEFQLYLLQKLAHSNGILVKERFDRHRVDYRLQTLQLEMQDREIKSNQDRLALETTYQSDVDQLNGLINKMQRHCREIELKSAGIKREYKLVEAKEAERRWDLERQYETEINGLEERLHNSLKKAERYFQAELSWQMEREMLQRQNMELRTQTALKTKVKDQSQEASKAIDRQLQEREKETHRQLTMYKTMAEQFEARWKEAMSWSQYQSMTMQEERNRLLGYVNTLREKITVAIEKTRGNLQEQTGEQPCASSPSPKLATTHPVDAVESTPSALAPNSDSENISFSPLRASEQTDLSKRKEVSDVANKGKSNKKTNISRARLPLQSKNQNQSIGPEQNPMTMRKKRKLNTVGLLSKENRP